MSPPADPDPPTEPAPPAEAPPAATAEPAATAATAEPAKTAKRERRSAVLERPGPEHPLALAWAALDRGDNVEARSLALAVQNDSSLANALRDEARAFLARMAPDPGVVGVLLATGALMLALALTWLGHR